MPELPEVETTLKGIQPHIENQMIKEIIIRHPKLRWPIPAEIKKTLKNQIIKKVQRRGKYLLFSTAQGTLILHLGMSGRLRILTEPTPPQKHDHLDIEFANNMILRFTDPRRFGAVLWTQDDPYQHPLLANLGPEPLEDQFSGNYLWNLARARKTPIKNFIMNSHIVVGVGNIYANEALFQAGIHPKQAAGKISKEKYDLLVKAIKKTLRSSIKQGGTTLKDFVDSKGNPGYFALHLQAYGRKGLPCLKCKTKMKEIRLGQRSTVFCPTCQT